MDDVTLHVNSSPGKLMGTILTYANGLPSMSKAGLCAKASMLLQNVPPAILLSGIDAYSIAAVKAGPCSVPVSHVGCFGRMGLGLAYAIMGLGLAYAGSQNKQVRGILMPVLAEGKTPLDVVSFTAISLGLVFVGSCNEDVAQAIIFALMDRSESDLADPLARFYLWVLVCYILESRIVLKLQLRFPRHSMKKLGNIVT
ncbi:hypothetical protein ACS0TY_003851 [Phlomoides rotata]